MSSLAESVSANARLFELAPLVRLLRHRFPERALYYQGHSSLACEPSLIDGVEFEPDRIVIRLNVGLLSSTSPLASYFTQLRHDPRAGPGLDELLRMCDHSLLKTRADAMHAASGVNSSPTSEALRESVWQLHQPRSATSMHWFFKNLFPELEVDVRRAKGDRRTQCAVARNGWASLGGAALGTETSVVVPGYDVTLATDESNCSSGESWFREATNRLTRVSLPWNAEARLDVWITLVDRAGNECLALLVTELGFASLADASTPSLMRI